MAPLFHRAAITRRLYSNSSKIATIAAYRALPSRLDNVAWAEAYLRTKWYLHPSNCYAVIDTGRKWGVIFCIAKN